AREYPRVHHVAHDEFGRRAGLSSHRVNYLIAERAACAEYLDFSSAHGFVLQREQPIAGNHKKKGTRGQGRTRPATRLFGLLFLLKRPCRCVSVPGPVCSVSIQIISDRRDGRREISPRASANRA